MPDPECEESHAFRRAEDANDDHDLITTCPYCKTEATNHEFVQRMACDTDSSPTKYIRFLPCNHTFVREHIDALSDARRKYQSLKEELRTVRSFSRYMTLTEEVIPTHEERIRRITLHAVVTLIARKSPLVPEPETGPDCIPDTND